MARPVIDLRGQPAIVTGASSGIGAGIAKHLAEAGARVVVNYRGEREAADAIVAASKSGGGEALAVQADLSKEDDVERLFAETLAAFGTAVPITSCSIPACIMRRRRRAEHDGAYQ